MLHLNVRSLLKKIDQIRLTFVNSGIDIITMSETWAKDYIQTDLMAISGYSVLRQDRDLIATGKTTGGGLITYISTMRLPDFKTLDRLSISSPHIEAQWTEITRPKSKNIIICNLYRPPQGTLKVALDYLNTCLNKLNRGKISLYIMGDLNIDYLNKTAKAYKSLTFFEKTNQLTQIIRETTRNTDKTNTLLDVILTDDVHVGKSGTLNIMISDHQPIYVVKKKMREVRNSALFEGRSYNSFDLGSFRDRLTKLDLTNLYEMEGPEEIWSAILGHIVNDLDIHCPIRKFIIKNYKPDWANDDLLEQIRNRDYFYKKAKDTKNKDDWNIAKHLRNIVNRNVRQAKADFVLNKLDQCKGDSAKFWKELKKIFPNGKGSEHGKISLKDEGKAVIEGDTADFINQFFINVGNPDDKHPAHSVVTKNSASDNDWTVEKVTETEVFNLVKSIKQSKSSGIAGVSNLVLKEALKVLISPVTHMYNLSLKNGTFPDSWKIAMVVPIPKGGCQSQVTNLRPISLLPQPGKILEKLLHTQLSNYMENEGLFSTSQHGFRKNHSTMGGTYQLLERINVNMDRRIPTLVTYIDFKKAFDCVQFDVLLAKIGGLGLDDIVVNWIKDYLSNRQQTVIANGKTSAKGNIKQGVPQGSILGPLLYLIYANDLQTVIKKCGYSFYADDTVLFSTIGDFGKAAKNMQRNLTAINKWCLMNGIHMNVKKTKYMVFGSKSVLERIKDVKLRIGDHELERVTCYSYLGVILDPSLNFDKQVNKVVALASAKVKQLKRMRKFLNTKAAMLVYKNMILPILEYGDIFLVAASKDNRRKLQTLQNKALRVIHRVDKYYESDLIHTESNLLKLKYRREQHLLQFMYTKRNDPNLLRPKRVGVTTRAGCKCNFRLRKPITEKYKRCASYTGPKKWNRLPHSVQISENGAVFKQKVLNIIMKRVMAFQIPP